MWMRVCIDGFPEDENQEGATIAEITITVHGDICVNWHDNGYRLDQGVKELIENSKEMLKNEYNKAKEKGEIAI